MKYILKLCWVFFIIFLHLLSLLYQLIVVIVYVVVVVVVIGWSLTLLSSTIRSLNHNDYIILSDTILLDLIFILQILVIETK